MPGALGEATIGSGEFRGPVCVRGAARPNGHTLALSDLAAGRRKAANIPASVRPHHSARQGFGNADVVLALCVCWRLFLAVPLVSSFSRLFVDFCRIAQNFPNARMLLSPFSIAPRRKKTQAPYSVECRGLFSKHKERLFQIKIRELIKRQAIPVHVQGCSIVAAPMHAPSRTSLLLPLLLSHNLPLPRVH
jgi:hypothetical protein